MMTLVFLVCSIGDPKLCEQKTIAFQRDEGVMACLMNAQRSMVEWSEEHPDMKIMKWRCDGHDIVTLPKDAPAPQQ